MSKQSVKDSQHYGKTQTYVTDFSTVALSAKSLVVSFEHTTNHKPRQSSRQTLSLKPITNFAQAVQA